MNDEILGPWVDVDALDESGEIEVIDANGNFVCRPHAATIGGQIARAALIAEAPKIAKEHKELILIAKTINEFASGPIPWGGCRCDYGEDGKSLLKGPICGRCAALARLAEIEHAP